MLYVFFMSYALVLIAEIAGDKLLYTTGVLATRYSSAPMLAGVGVAFMLKMLAAVLFGAAVAGFEPRAVAALSAVTFVTMAITLCVKRPENSELPRTPAISRAMVVSFAAVFFSEWGDIGQITAATLSTRYNTPLLVWAGATLAMVTKAALAISLGAALQRRIPKHALRYCGASLLLFMGVLSVLELAR